MLSLLFSTPDLSVGVTIISTKLKLIISKSDNFYGLPRDDDTAEGDFGDVGGLGDLLPPSHAVLSSDGSSAMLSLLFSTPDLSSAVVASIVSMSPVHQEKYITIKIGTTPVENIFKVGQFKMTTYCDCTFYLLNKGSLNL